MSCRTSGRRPVQRSLLHVVGFVSVFTGQWTHILNDAYALSPVPPPGQLVVLFDTNSAEIDARITESIQQALADWRSSAPEAEFLVTCRADRVGPEDYNMALSERRCEAVRSFLTKGGVPLNRIETRAYGELENQVPTADEVAEQANRVAIIELKRDEASP